MWSTVLDRPVRFFDGRVVAFLGAPISEIRLSDEIDSFSRSCVDSVATNPVRRRGRPSLRRPPLKFMNIQCFCCVLFVFFVSIECARSPTGSLPGGGARLRRGGHVAGPPRRHDRRLPTRSVFTIRSSCHQWRETARVLRAGLESGPTNAKAGTASYAGGRVFFFQATC